MHRTWGIAPNLHANLAVTFCSAYPSQPVPSNQQPTCSIYNVPQTNKCIIWPTSPKDKTQNQANMRRKFKELGETTGRTVTSFIAATSIKEWQHRPLKVAEFFPSMDFSGSFILK
mmetsp:Transcript_6442/g.10556  ORF Transcript_6442/g.10556 Transcript_6442/m.10556 type:complete len:115 (-) Transcript_6442:858-1202(-)